MAKTYAPARRTQRYDPAPARDNQELIAVGNRIATGVERLYTLLDDFFGTYLNARFSHGKPGDRWPRRRY